MEKNKKEKWTVEYAPGFDKSMHKLFSNNLIYSIPRWFHNQRYKIKWAWQRVFRGWDDRFQFEFCGMFPDLIIGVCDSMIKYSNGHPAFLKSMKQWHSILRQIKKGFVEYNRHGDDELLSINEQKKISKELKKSLLLLAEHYESLWD